MIKHIVCWKLINRTGHPEHNADALAIREALHGLRGRIPGLLHIEVGFDFSGKETSGDVVLYSEFESREALALYQHHPLHVEAGKTVRPRTCDRRMIDYEI
jgi:hypothetical protein